MKTRRPSMADVAQSAGVSSQTVSRVSNRRPEVDEVTRTKVLQAMEELGYRPNAAARALKTGRFASIGVVTSYLASFGTVHTLDAIVASADAAGYGVTLIPVVATGGAVTSALDRLQQQFVDGIIVTIEPHTMHASNIVLPPGIPIVVVNSGPDDSFAVVDSDQIGGATLATRHLLDLGHRTVHHVAGPEYSVTAQNREHGWRTTLTAARAFVPRVVHGDWSAESGYQLGLDLAADRALTAIFAANDQMALGCLQALRERGRSVPHDVSIVGFDDMPEAPYAFPPLTTIHQEFGQVGRTAVSELLSEMANPSERTGTQPPASSIPTQLVVRSSTGPPPG